MIGELELQVSLASPVSCIVGAPGSGKTAQLRRAVFELERSLAPERILVLTPTRAAATKLRDQIALDSGKPSSAPRARSLSSFAFDLLSRRFPNLKLLTGPGQQALLKELVDLHPDKSSWGLNPKALGLNAFAQELRDLFQVAMEFQLSTDQLVALQESYPSLKLRPVIDLLPEYLKALEGQGLLDPASLLARAAQEPLSDFDWVLVDDAQDLPEAGLKLLERIRENSSILLFGDPDSSIQGFRSAESGEFLRFGNLQFLARELPQAPQIQQLMSRFAVKLPPAGAGRQRSQLAKTTSSITAPIFSSTAAEADYLAAKLRRFRLEQNTSFSKMAVVVRTQAQVDQLSRELSSRAVPVRLASSAQPLSQNPLTRAILDACWLGLRGKNTELLREILLSGFIGLNPIELRRLERQLVHQTGLSVSQAWEEVMETGFDFESREARVLNRLLEIIRKIEQAEINSAHQLISMIWEFAPQGLKELALGSSEVSLAANRDLDAVLRLFGAAERFDERQSGSLESFVSQQLNLTIAEDSLSKTAQSDAVLVMTSSALGSESFELIALPRLQDGIWPNLRPRNSLLGATSLRAYLAKRSDDPSSSARGELSDEIRLFYKALGAARGEVLISAMKSSDEQPSQFFTIGGLEQYEHSEPVDFDLRRLVGRLRFRLLHGDQSTAGVLAGFALAGIAGADPKSWQGLVEPSSAGGLFDSDQPILLSASSLEAFQRCPLHWFVKTFAVGESSFQASVGTLLHSAFELATRPEDVPQYVESNWHSLEFEHIWQSESQKRRAIEMSLLAASYLAENPTPYSVEQGFELEYSRLRIRGKIDRVERTSTGLIVADLKTGKSNLDAKNNLQLAVYQLALGQISPEESVQGARLVSVGTGKLKISEQPPLSQEAISALYQAFDDFEQQGSESELVAQVSSHCAEDGSCQLLLARQVADD